MRNCFLLLAACFAILFGISACGGSSDPGENGSRERGQQDSSEPAENGSSDAGLHASTESKGRIGFSMKNANNPFFKVIADNLAAEAEQHGYEVQILSGDEDVSIQRGQIKDWIALEVKAIVLTPVDSKSIGPAIREANAAGIPVFTCDLKCTDPDAKVVTHIATDNFQGGTLAGDAMIDLIGESGGQVLVLDLKSAESCVQRVLGFKQQIDAHNAAGGARIEIVAELECLGAKDRGYSATQDALQSHPGIDAIFAINDPAALGASAALVSAGKQADIPIIGFDGQIEGKRAILEGKLHADPIQFPDRMGRDTMRAILAYFAGEEVPAETLIPSELYTKADAEVDPALAQ